MTPILWIVPFLVRFAAAPVARQRSGRKGKLEATKLDIVHTDEGGHRGVDESSWDQLYSVDSESDCEEGSDIVIY